MKLLIWDFDGTLGYREGGWSGALLEVLEGSGLAEGISRGDLSEHLKVGFPWHTPDEPREALAADEWWGSLEPIFRNAFVGVGLEGAAASHYAKEVRTFYTRLASWRLYPDTQIVLERLSSLGWQHALLTNHVPELPKILRYLGLQEQFVGVFNSAETGVEKPHARAFRNVLEALEPQTAWMIGDNPVADIAGAEAVGLRAMLLHRNGAPASSSRVCRNLAEVTEILRLAEH